ncbi:hypothetical protein EV2_039169 [Malus domestica]
MAPKATKLFYETREGITTMRRLLNGLHCLWVGLQTCLFFEEEAMHSLGPAWTSQVPIAVENNMPKVKWFTINLLLAKSGI